uniref:Rpr4901.1 n=1 Tax=Hordeum vulgare subsp. vulgare TaxID=112509 RepID=A2T580_HORVV|nr:Rpr4901.1 [Hordeum vulgare subsp. vulgare]ABN04098.1 Rpr4901.1 [Hordeum vulgare subsp. vulgare]
MPEPRFRSPPSVPSTFAGCFAKINPVLVCGYCRLLHRPSGKHRRAQGERTAAGPP